MNYDEFLDKLKVAGLSKQDFCELSGLNENTLKGWATKRQGRRTQIWVRSWLELYIKNKEQEIIISALKN